MKEVFSAVCDMAMQACNLSLCFSAVPTPFFLSGQLSLKYRKFFLLPLKGVERFKDFTVGERRKILDSHVNPYLGRSWSRRLVLIFRLDADVPFIAAANDGDVFYRTDDILTFPISYPPDFWQLNLLFDLIEFNSLRKTNRVMPELLLVFREIRPFFGKIGVSPIKIL